MIFTPYNVEAILEGRKTVTRRPIHHDPWSYKRKPCAYKVRKEYPIQIDRNDGPSLGWIKVKKVTRGPLADALRAPEFELEGFATAIEFAETWIQIHGTIDIEQEVWRVQFELIEAVSNR